MNLDRVTITGADDRTDIGALVALTEEFPFVEWGVLVSKSSEGSARFPTREWIYRFIVQMGELDRRRGRQAWLSMHICGRWVRQLLQGQTPECVYFGSFPRFQRYQLNFHGLPHALDWTGFNKLVDTYFFSRQLIFQVDGTENGGFYSLAKEGGINAVPLFDTSGGAGIVPNGWPDTRVASWAPYYGYAGGLGPGNIATELPRIAEAAHDARVWIDMERNVRSEDDLDLQLDKVRSVLEYCAPFIEVKA